MKAPTKDKFDILEERCNIQERKLIEIYNDLKYFTQFEYVDDKKKMRNKVKWIRRKAELMQGGLYSNLKKGMSEAEN